MADDAEFHAYWYELQKALTNKTPVPPFHDGHPQGGCYQVSYRNKENPSPVRIFWDEEDDMVVVLVDGVKTDMHNSVWLSCGRNPVTWDAYQHRIKHGVWPGSLSSATPGIGDNSAPLPLQERVALETSKAAAWLETIGTIKTKAQADEAANASDEIAKLCLKLEKLHEETKAAPWAECKRIDAELLTPAQKGREISVKLKRLIGKFHDAATEAARKRQEDHDRMAAEILNRPTPPVPTPPPTSFGTTGRKVNVTAKLVAKITDFDKVYHFCREEPQVKELLQKLAQRAVDGGILPPGVERIEETSVR